MGISTKNVKKGNFISKELAPGVNTVKIDRFELTKNQKPKNDGDTEWILTLHIEGKPEGGEFEGFDKVYGDPSKGKYAGKSMKLKATQYPMRTFSWKDKKDGSNKTKTADDQLLEFIQKLCDITGTTWLTDVDGKFDTFPQLIAGLNKDKVFKDVYFTMLIAADERLNAKGYKVYYGFLPDWRTAKTAIALEGQPVDSFDQDIHINKDKNAATTSSALNEGVDVEDEDEEFTSDDSSDDELFDMDDDIEDEF